MLSLNGLLRHLSNGCRTGVRPPGITATSILRRCRSAFTDSVRWAQKESQTSSDRCEDSVANRYESTPSLLNAKISHLSITSITSELWNRNLTNSYLFHPSRPSCGTILEQCLEQRGLLECEQLWRSRKVEVFLPSAATASVTVKLLFSALQDFTGTVLLPLNSRVLLDGSSNRIGVSSILNSLESEWPYRCRSAITNRWNWMVFSSRSCGSRWARVVLVRRLMEWRFFHLWYQPSEALKSGSLLNSFAFSRRINPLTAIPVKDKRDQLFDLFWQHEKLANQKRSFPRFV